MRKKRSLAETHPELAKQWHPTKNGDLSPSDITRGNQNKVWWICFQNRDHSWQATANSRVSCRTNCPYCSGRYATPLNCLAVTHPELAQQWHPTKNGDLTPFDVKAGSNKKVWWICEVGDDHEWQSVIASRKSADSCSCCLGLKVVPSNCLATTHPELAQQWHPTKNGDLTPSDVTAGSSKKAWWLCENNHEWLTMIGHRGISGTKCPVCFGQMTIDSNCLATTHPELAQQWHPTKNGDLTPFDIRSGSNKKAWWSCNEHDDHEWRAAPYVRLRSGCPCCTRKKVVPSNCLATTHPELAQQWHPTKNGDLTPFDVVAGSHKKAWWKCGVENDHEWVSTILYRLRVSCPCCAGRKVVSSNCLATTYPELAQQWHPTKNGDLTPREVTSGSQKKVWWLCDSNSDHEWKAVIASRKKGHGCPRCRVYRNEERCRVIFENMFGFVFDEDTSTPFKNPKTGRSLRYDGYSSELSLAWEYNGIQHYIEEMDERHIAKWGAKTILASMDRDVVKRDLSRECGIELIVIKYTVPEEDFEDHIYQNLSPKLKRLARYHKKDCVDLWYECMYD